MRVALKDTAKDSCFVVGGREIPYFDSMRKLADLFGDNFKKYESGVSTEITAAGPV
jgi:hypothetical protein